MEERKLKEIEHSRKRREVLQGFERIADTHAISQVDDLDALVSDPEKFKYYFSNMKYYAITKSSEKYKENWIAKRAKKGKVFLDFGCGNGENGIYAGLQGATVKGIDISPEGIENCKSNAKKLGLEKLCEHIVMDGENLTFEDSSFDYGVEYGVLHHVDLDKSLSEISRVLKPNAEMICIEALRHNPIIHAYRKKTPHLRTEWEVEHILGVESLDVIKKYFNKVDVKFFHLTSLALVPFRKTPFFPFLLRIFDKVDSILLRTQAIGKFGWIMVIEMSDPIK